MTRKEFVKLSALLGISVPFQSVLSSCANRNVKSESRASSFDGKVIVIGAGPAGMAAGYLLAQQGVDFQILEASAIFGGRVACATSISNFPTPLGAEWVHTDDDVFQEIVNDKSVDTSSPVLVGYSPVNDFQDVVNSDGKGFTRSPLGEGAGVDTKFVNSCWREFFGEYIIPKISDNIQYNVPVTAIDYSGDKVSLTAGAKAYEADKVIITVPLKILQEGSINFTPTLPKDKIKAMNRLEVMPGFKCFMKCDQKFYGAYTLFEDTFIGGGQWIYYDAAYGQNTDDNIMGFLCVGPKAADYPYTNKDQLLAAITKELKAIYGDEKVNIVDFDYTNWDEVPYIKGSYLGIEADGTALPILAKPVNQKLYFAGSAYTDQTQKKGKKSFWGFSENWSNVHAATRAAKRAVEEVLV
jgi:monoamine oxidase